MKKLICLLLSLPLISNAKMEDAQSKVPALNFSCEVGTGTSSSYAWLNDENKKIVVDGKIAKHQAFSILYVPTWEKEVTYKASKDYSVKLEIYAVKYQQRGDFLYDQPRFEVTASLLKGGKVISQASSESEAVMKFVNEIENTSGRSIELNLKVANLLPSAEADRLSYAQISCQMPINWKFTGKRD